MDKENMTECTTNIQQSKKKGKTNLGAAWQLSAAMLSRPLELGPLIALSVSKPHEFTEKGVLHKLVKLLNKTANDEADKKSKIDILRILGNLAAHEEYREAIKQVIMDVSEWFELYMHEQESATYIPADIRLIADIEEPTLHKAMLIVLARCFDYRLRTEDLLELTDNDSVLGLATVIGVLEEGFTEVTTIRKKRDATAGKVAQWEQGTVYSAHEKVLVVQCCRLLRGFTLPGSYISSKTEEEVSEKSIEEFNRKINQLLALTLDAELVEKVTEALCDCVFPDEYVKNMKGISTENENGEDAADRTAELCDKDHLAIISMQTFLHNLYLYANDVYLPLFRQHLLVESRVTPDMVLPYLHSCLVQSCEENLDEHITDLLVQGICSSLKTLIIATFRAPQTSPAMKAFTMLNPTHTLIESCWKMLLNNMQMLVLLIFFNVNLDALNISSTETLDGVPESSTPHALLHSVAAIFCAMESPKQEKALKLLKGSGQLPVTRDVQSYSLVMGMLGSIFKADMNAATRGEESESQAVSQAVSEAKGGAQVSEAKGSSSSLAADTDGDWCPGKSQAKSQSPAAKGGPSAAATKTSGQPKAESKGESSQSSKFRLLGDLPALIPGAGPKNTVASQGLQLPKSKPKKSKPTQPKTQKPAQNLDPNVPAEFCCAINGHIMKEPVRANGNIYERGTIEMWLDQQGSVCPITGSSLMKADLVTDAALKAEIMRWHIKQSMNNHSDDFLAVEDEEDIYDF